MAERKGKTVKLPVRMVEGRWELTYGGEIEVFDGATAEIVINVNDISDPAFFYRVTERRRVKVLDSGQPLRVLLATKDLRGVSDDLRNLLIPFEQCWQEMDLSDQGRWVGSEIDFYQLTLGSPSDRQVNDAEMQGGGLWMEFEGRTPKLLHSPEFDLPDIISPEPAYSLNHAFTLLSQVYEPWRLSHTGSVYERVFYQETDGKWYPLSLLRDYEQIKQDQGIAHGLWQDFLGRMTKDDE